MVLLNTNFRLSCIISAELDSESKLTEENAIYRHGSQFAEHLGQGLSDNWSQVQLSHWLLAWLLGWFMHGCFFVGVTVQMVKISIIARPEIVGRQGWAWATGSF